MSTYAILVIYMEQLSVWPLVAAALASTLIGYCWYHPRLFGGEWMRDSGMTPEMAERGARRAHRYEVFGFVAALVVAYVLRMLLIGLGVSDVVGAIKIGAWLWLGFAAPILLGAVLWEHRPLKLYCINIGYWLLALVAMAVILVI